MTHSPAATPGLMRPTPGLMGRLRVGMLSILCGLAGAPALAANTITLSGGEPAPTIPGAVQTVLASDVHKAQGIEAGKGGALQNSTFAGLTFQGNWFVTPTDLSLQNGNQLDQWTLFSSNNGNRFNLTSMDLKWRGGQADTAQGWLNFYLNDVLVDTGSTDKLYDNPNASLAFVMPGSLSEIRHITPASNGYYNRIDVVFNHSITPNSLGVVSFALRSSSSSTPFGLADSTVVPPPSAPALTVPEPETNALLMAGLAALALTTRRRHAGRASRGV